MIKKKVKTNKGEPLTLDGLMTELNNLFTSHKDDPKAMDIKSMIQSLLGEEYDEKAEDDAMTACPDGLEPVVEEKNSPYDENYFEVYHTVKDAVNTTITVGMEDAHGKVIRAICFLSSPQMIEGIAETLGEMKKPTIAAFEDGVLTKAAILCGMNRVQAHKQHGKLAAFAFDEQKGGMCRLSINRKDGYDFIFGENGVTRFIIFDEEVCPYVIPADIVQDDRKWGKRMTSELPKLIEQRIEESKSGEKLPFADAVTPALTKIDIPILDKKPSVCNPTETKQPIIADVMNEFAEAKTNDKIEVTDDFCVEDTNPDCFRAIAEYMAKEAVDSVHFYTDEDGLIHCDVQIKTVYKVELEDSDKK